jgi:1-phosphofructokinase family hexose kinase
MILTLTPNPTIDRTVFVRDFSLGAVVRAEREVVTPSGKGIDASLVIHELGGETLALGLSAGLSGELLTKMLDQWGVRHDLILAGGETRTATVLVDLAAGSQSTISASTLRAEEADLERLLARIDRYACRSWGLVCGGSLPRGLPEESYACLVGRARERGLYTLLDTSGEALRRGIAGRPHVVKVNRDELAVLEPGTGVVGPWSSDVVEMARKLDGAIGRWASDAIVVTLGGEGALCITPETDYYVRPPRVPVSNTAGAGDALAGGLMLARCRGWGWPEALALGTAAAASVVMNEGTAVCRRQEVADMVHRVSVWKIDQRAGHMDRIAIQTGNGPLDSGSTQGIGTAVTTQKEW